MATVSPAKPSAIHASRRTKSVWGPCEVSGAGGTTCCAEIVVALTSTSAAILLSDASGDLAFNVGPESGWCRPRGQGTGRPMERAKCNLSDPHPTLAQSRAYTKITYPTLWKACLCALSCLYSLSSSP